MRRVLQFLRHGLFEVDLRKVGFCQRTGLAALRVIVYIVVHWNRRLVGLRASGLALVSLLALVPLLALAFGIANGLGYGETLVQTVEANTRDWPPQLRDGVDELRRLVEGLSLQALGWASTLILAYSGLALFVRIEQALNDAWHATDRRPWLRRVSDFISLVMVVPVLTLAALLSSSAMQSARWITELREGFPWLGSLYEAGIGIVPHVLLWVAFTALYKLMPSARVEWRSALIGGVIAGSSLLFMHGFYIHFQVGVARANAIYATLAALPLLLIYLQVAWTIVLLGADVGYAVQNLHLIGPGRRLEDLSFDVHERVALKLTEATCDRFARGQGPLSLGDLATELDLPSEWLETISSELSRSGVLAITQAGEVTPAKPCRQITVDLVRRGLRGTCPSELDRRLALAPTLAREIAATEAREREFLALAHFAEPVP